MNPIRLGAGDSITYVVLLDFEYGAAKDWAFTAWGTRGDVKVEHLGGQVSDHLPNINDNDR